MGKTQIALEYAYQHALEYSAVFWIGAETEEQVAASFLQIAQTLQLLERKENDESHVIAAEQIRTLLKAHGWGVHLKKRRGKAYVYATRKVGQHTQSRCLASLSNLAACLAAAGRLPNARPGEMFWLPNTQALGNQSWDVPLLPSLHDAHLTQPAKPSLGAVFDDN